MKQTLRKINELIKINLIEKYAIAGGMAQFYYIEPSVTYDLDLIVQIHGEENNLSPLSKIYLWAESNGLETESEHIIINGIPVQFLLAYNDLVKEALINNSKIVLFDEETYILKAEYLMAIMLQTNRLIDRERLSRFLYEYDYDKTLFLDIIQRFNLNNEYQKFIGGANG